MIDRATRDLEAFDLEALAPVLRDGVGALVADMREHGYQRSDPVREIFALLGDRWTMLILLVLAIGRWRHAELRRALGQLAAEGKISQRVLTLKLRALERDGIVMRDASRDVPPRVSYELTALGHSLVGETRRLMGWVHSHRDAIDTARTAFAADGGD